jgi:hypothetical protein
MTTSFIASHPFEWKILKRNFYVAVSKIKNRLKEARTFQLESFQIALDIDKFLLYTGSASKMKLVQYNTLRHKSQAIFDAMRKTYYHQFSLVF